MSKVQNGVPSIRGRKMVPLRPGQTFTLWLEPAVRYVHAGEDIGLPIRGEDDGIGYIRRTVQHPGYYFSFGDHAFFVMEKSIREARRAANQQPRRKHGR